MTTDPLSTLIHDVNSKCASLRGAAALLRKASKAEADELVSLMAQEARSLAAAIESYKGI